MDIKFNCSNPGCQRRISVDVALAGQSLACPACATSLRVPVSANIKFNCPAADCGQHMVVDVAEAGRFVRCPACDKPVRVPGDPPKPIVAQTPVSAPGSSPVAKAAVLTSRKRALPPALIPFRRLLLGWGLGAVLCALVLGGLRLRAWAALPPHLDAMLEETYFHGEILTAPAINQAGTALLYVRTVETGVGLFLVDLGTLARSQIALAKPADHDRGGAVKLFGWSPHDEMLAFATIQDGQENRHVVIGDGTTGKEINAFDTPKPVVTGAWLTANSLVLLDETHRLYVYNLQPDLRLGQYGGHGLVSARQLDRSSHDLVPDSDTSVAYLEKDNLWRLNLASGQVFQLTHLTNATLDGLDYNPATGKYLFGSVAAVTKQRQLCQYDPRSAQAPIRPLNCTNYEVKGRWLPGDQGVAYVGLAGKRDYLSVTSQYGDPATNLFTAAPLTPWRELGYGALAGDAFPEGRQVVRTFSASPKRDKLYVVAAMNYEPLAIWEYDVASQQLRNVVPVKEPLRYSRFITPVAACVTNQHGKIIDYYYLPPAGMDPRKKYPVVVDQFTDVGYLPNSQFIANAGMFFVAVCPYGQGRGEFPPATEDTLAVYDAIIKNPNVNPKQIYLIGESAGTVRIAELLNDHASLWRGAIISAAVAFPEFGLDASLANNRILFSFGEGDSVNNQLRAENFAQTACTRLMTTRILYWPGGHVLFDLGTIKQKYRAIAQFILTDN